MYKANLIEYKQQFTNNLEQEVVAMIKFAIFQINSSNKAKTDI